MSPSPPSSPGRPAVVLSVEHGGYRVPRRLVGLFQHSEGLLRSHRGWDFGAARLARGLSRNLGVSLAVARTSRLAIDLNRSLHNPAVWSHATRNLPIVEKRRLIALHRRHWNRVRSMIELARARGSAVVHVAVHSFTPELDGVERRADISWLYDPARPGEAGLSDRWREAVAGRLPVLRYRMNYPYRGAADGLVTTLRREYPAAGYLAVELEVNQMRLESRVEIRLLTNTLAAGLCQALEGAG